MAPRERIVLHCYCCGNSYERGHFICCAPPPNVPSHVWLEQFCHVCGTETRGKCPKHCTCPKKSKQPVTIDNWQNTMKIADNVVQAIRKEWMPYRENREPGEDG